MSTTRILVGTLWVRLQETYLHLYNGGAPAALKSRIASAGEMETLTNADAYATWSGDYLK